MNSFISPAIADVMLWLMYITLAVAMGVTAYSVWHGLRNRRKGSDVVNGVPAGRIGWLVAVGFVLIMVLPSLWVLPSPSSRMARCSPMASGCVSLICLYTPLLY
jgi:hypothetical protein